MFLLYTFFFKNAYKKLLSINVKKIIQTPIPMELRRAPSCRLWHNKYNVFKANLLCLLGKTTHICFHADIYLHLNALLTADSQEEEQEDENVEELTFYRKN